MKITIRFFMAAALILPLFAACEDITKEDERPNPPITVTFEGKAVNLDDPNATDAWSGGESVGVFMKKNKESLSDATVLNDIANRKFTVGDEGKLEPADESQEFIYVQDGSKVDFVAYSPYSAQLAGYAIPVSVAEQYSSGSLDLLISGNATGKYKGQNVVKLDFRRALSQIIITVSAGEGVREEDLPTMQATLHGVHAKGSFSLSNLTAVYDASSADELTFALSEDGKTGKLLVLPTPEGDQEQYIVFEVGDVVNSYYFKPDFKFEYGRTLRLNVKLSVASAEVSIDGVEDWEIEDETGEAAVS